ncbi:hypothetical protein PGH07_09985 [Sulfurovum sp. zt1-1]|uniref:AsmA-like C-terminal domain-containing protein n=1 Tax=Sulfurovum zhangzhouensis TaxID=3019067 RepID=A0ABT7R088_9BACT|nr:hypothetical protein [Sulfurovum zhangzhouensis]MDM5272508.1 hypothetical protein [Sulfurovum zhangzhouensis]
MMNKIVIFILLIAALLGSVFFVAFTPSGNALFLPYINAQLKDNVEGAKVEIVKLSLKPGFVTAVAKVNDSVDVVAEGPIDLFDQSFDVAYTLDAQKIQSQEFTIDKPLHIQGKATGRMEDMHITGSGEAFASDIHYDLNFHENQPRNIKLYLKEASIAEILVLAGERPYAKGHMSVNVNMPTLDPSHPQGEAHLEIKDGWIDAKAIKQQYNIALPSDTSLQANITANAQGDTLLAKGEILTSLATLTLSETRYHLQAKKLESDYLLDIPDMTQLKNVVQAPIEGKLKLAGNVLLNGEKVSATGMTHSLGGESRFYYENGALNATLKDVEASNFLKMIGSPGYASGKLSANVYLSQLRDLSGKFDLKSSGGAESSVVKKELDVNLGKQFNYDISANGKIKDHKVYAQTKLDTTMANLSMPDMVYDIAPGALHSSYHFYIPDLRKLQPLTEKEYRGDMDFRGEISKQKDLVITGEGKEFDGSVSYKLVNEQIKADVHGATVSKVMYMLGYPQVLEALSEAQVDYNFATQRGRVDAKLDSARILPNQLTILLKQLLQIDLTQERYNQATFVSTISPTRFNFDFIAQNPISHLKIVDGTLDKRSEQINASVDMRYKDKALKGKITGTLNRPKVALDTSALLKSKIDGKVDNLLDKKLKDGGGDNVKGLLKGFLK